MANEVVPGVWWLHGTRGCNVYLLRARDGRLALVDSGFGGNVAPILREVEALTGKPELDAILLTHRHVDHTGAAAGLHERTGARVVLGAADCTRDDEGRHRLFHDWRPPNWVRRPLGAAFGIGASHAEVPVHIPVQARCEVLPGIVAVPVPGHTRGTLCYLAEDQQATFTGDLFISHHDRLSRAVRAANDDDGEYLASLATFAPRVLRYGFPGHGHPVLDHFAARFDDLAHRPRGRMHWRNAPKRMRRMAQFGRYVIRKRRGDGP